MDISDFSVAHFSRDHALPMWQRSNAKLRQHPASGGSKVSGDESGVRAAARWREQRRNLCVVDGSALRLGLVR